MTESDRGRISVRNHPVHHMAETRLDSSSDSLCSTLNPACVTDVVTGTAVINNKYIDNHSYRTDKRTHPLSITFGRS